MTERRRTAQSAEQQKQDILEAAAGLGAHSLPPHFLDRFYQHVPPQDVLARTPEELCEGALSLWQFARERSPGHAIARVHRRDEAETATIEIVNDDMPYLVDSVSAVLAEAGLTIELIIHPVMEKGAGARESLMRIEVSGAIDPEGAARLVEKLEETLALLRAVIEDQRAMRAKLAEVRAGLDRAPPPLAGEEISEGRDFLAWLENDNFIFLGYREYCFDAIEIVPASGLGVLRDDRITVFDGLRDFQKLPPEVRAFLVETRLLMITKSNRRTLIHRAGPMEVIGVKIFDAGGRAVGERLFLGLFTSLANSRRPTDIPLLRRKVRAVLERSRVDPAGHDGKALLEILATLPRDELFALSEDALFDTALGVLNLQERRRVAMFLRRDPFERFVSVLIYLPPERYDLEVSERFRAILTAAFAAARIETVEVTRDRSALARVWIVLRTTPGLVPAVDNAALEHRLIEATRRWADHLEEAMIATCGEEAGLALFHRYGKAFPPAYRDTVEPLAAVDDIACLEKVRGQAAIAASFYLRGEPGLKLYRTDAPAALSDVVPILENFGFRVITEVPHAIETEPTLWIQDFGLSAPRASDLMAARARLEEAFARIWAGEMENDGLNRLILTSTLDGRQVTVFRLYTHYLRQAVLTPALREEALHAHPAIAAKLIAFFEARFKEGGEAESAVLERAILADLDAVPSFEEDHALRDFLHLIKATVRTNYFQRKPYLSVKIASQHLPMLAPPRPLAEIFVMSSTMEGVHARGGLVARGGIRWSERKQDFRSEILGLMKTQMVKNAVIVPVGAKGGFIVKGTSPADIVAGYQTLIRGLLDLTDNLVGSRVVPPAGIERRDEDDPYLVVAADKGTARFSDIANAMASEYGFWLGDAFASGGSHGFDHKAMGITARGAMETVKRHFRERGVDLAATLISVVGVGDMSGDVFGNFMIGSPHLKLVAAFDHRHIFLDPDPDQAASFAERRRLFALSQSSWADYDPRLISAGGGVFARSGKAIPISVEVRKRLGITAPVLDPPELIKAMLAAPVDLLWFGGIGTYVKGTNESHASIHDRSNDGLRIEGQEVRAQVIGEGANLAVTQLGRIEFARSGGAINTDAIDNSAGVDTSDHEVNIKILLDDAVAAGELSRVRRDALLREMVEEVAALVLKDNVDQGLALTLAGKGSDRAALARVMGALERSGKLDRALEFLPEAVDRDLTRPELAVLMAYVKTTLAVDLAASPLSMDPAMDADFRAYFPKMLATHFGPALARHRLRREIIATALANDLVNRAGLTLVSELQRQSGASPPVIAKAYAIARTVLDQETLWEGVSALDFAIPASLQMEMWLALRRAVARGSRRLVRRPLGAIALEIDTYRPKIAAIEAALPSLLPGMLEERRDALHARGVPLALGQRIAGLPFMAASFDIIDHAKGRDVVEVARRYFARLISVMNFRRMARATSSNPAAGMRKAPTPPMT